jgi:hypothetical protein
MMSAAQARRSPAGGQREHGRTAAGRGPMGLACPVARGARALEALAPLAAGLVTAIR